MSAPPEWSVEQEAIRKRVITLPDGVALICASRACSDASSISVPTSGPIGSRCDPDVAAWPRTDESTSSNSSSSSSSNNSSPSSVRLVGGCDISFASPTSSHCCVCISVVRLPELEPVLIRHRLFTVTTPFISGYLAFREAGPLVDLWRELRADIDAGREAVDVWPDVILLDGNGAFHARRCGLACHVGVALGVPTIGVAKTLTQLGALTQEIVRDASRSCLAHLGDALLLREEKEVLAAVRVSSAAPDKCLAVYGDGEGRERSLQTDVVAGKRMPASADLHPRASDLGIVLRASRASLKKADITAAGLPRLCIRGVVSYNELECCLSVMDSPSAELQSCCTSEARVEVPSSNAVHSASASESPSLESMSRQASASETPVSTAASPSKDATAVSDWGSCSKRAPKATPESSFSKPLYISVGHLCSLREAAEIVLSCCNYKNPMPIRLADKISRQVIAAAAAEEEEGEGGGGGGEDGGGGGGGDGRWGEGAPTLSAAASTTTSIPTTAAATAAVGSAPVQIAGHKTVSVSLPLPPGFD